jgi:hypothetical protein
MFRSVLLVVIVGATLAVSAPAASAAGGSVKRCGHAGTTKDGLGVTNVRARGVSCATARRVARRARWGAEGRTRTSRVDGRTWRCTTTQAATGTDPGHVARTKVECRRPGRSSLVRFELRS